MCGAKCGAGKEFEAKMKLSDSQKHPSSVDEGAIRAYSGERFGSATRVSDVTVTEVFMKASNCDLRRRTERFGRD